MSTINTIALSTPFACHLSATPASRSPCCMQVWENLSLKDMAKAAGTCKDFATHAKETRSELRTLKLPTGALALLV